MNIPAILEELRATTKRNEKIAILKNHEDNENLKTVLKAAIDPFSTFYITSIPTEADVEGTSDVDWSVGEDEIFVSVLREAMNFSNRKHIKEIFFVLADIFQDKPEYMDLIDNILKKDLNAGVSGSTVNAVWPKFIHEFKVMKASEEKKVKHITYPARCDLKMDGVAIFAFYDKGMVTFKSSSGKEFLKLPTLESFVLDFADRIGGYPSGFVLCGELVAHSSDGRIDRQASNGLAYKALLGTISDEEESRLYMYAYDMLSSATQLERGVDARPLEERVSDLCLLDHRTNLISVPFQEVESYEHAIEVFKDFVSKGEEGVILKNMNSKYETKRSNDWIKLKKEITVDVRITGWTKHTKVKCMLGSMTIATDDGQIEGKIGTKLTEEDRIKLFRMALDGELVGRVAEIVCHEVTYSKTKKKHSFYLPRFERFRWDKDETDSLEKIMDM